MASLIDWRSAAGVAYRLDAHQTDDPAVPISTGEVCPGPDGRTANLGTQVKKAAADHDGDVSSPRRAVQAEQGKIEIGRLVAPGMVETGVIPELTGTVVRNDPIEQGQHAVGVALTVRPVADRLLRRLLRMGSRRIGRCEDPGRPTAVGGGP